MVFMIGEGIDAQNIYAPYELGFTQSQFLKDNPLLRQLLDASKKGQNGLEVMSRLAEITVYPGSYEGWVPYSLDMPEEFRYLSTDIGLGSFMGKDTTRESFLNSLRIYNTSFSDRGYAGFNFCLEELNDREAIALPCLVLQLPGTGVESRTGHIMIARNIYTADWLVHAAGTQPDSVLCGDFCLYMQSRSFHPYR